MIPVNVNIRLVALIAALSLLQFVVIPLALLPISDHFGWLLLLAVIATPTHWSLIHEAIHGNLLPGRRLNGTGGRALAVAFGSPFQLLRFGHLMHHRFNRTPIQRSDVSANAERPGVRESAWYYFLITIGLYLFEAAAALFALSPRRFLEKLVIRAFGEETPDGRTMAPMARKQLLEAPGLNRLRLDGLLICVLFGLGFWLYGAHWWMLAAAIAARGVLVSLLDNAYHYGNELEDAHAGYNLSLPKALQSAFLNFNLHEVHHQHPRAPWSELPKLFGQSQGAYHGSMLRAVFRQFLGLIPERIAAKGGADLRKRSPKTRKTSVAAARTAAPATSAP
ncbi:MAG: fatty acid desaturase [Pseudomonadota bacterium]